MDGFVDDKTAWANLAEQLTDDPNAQAQLIDHIHNNLQSIAQEWEQILTAMGGKLELSKCFYYMIQWVFDEHGRPSMAPPNPKPLSIQDSISNETVTIKQFPTKQPHRTLGAFLCPAEDESMAIDTLTERATFFANKTRSSFLYPADVQLATVSKYAPSMGYILITSAIDEPTLRKIQSPAVRAFASRMGYNRNYPPSLLHGPQRVAGNNMTDLYISQGQSKVEFILRQFRTKGKVLEVLQMVLSWFQHYSGLTTSVWEDVLSPIDKYVPGKWFHVTRNFLRDSDLYMKIPHFTPVLRREHDCSLMESAMQHTTSPTELKDIHNCALYLRVHTLSEISTTCGTYIYKGCIYSKHNKTPTTESKSAIHWPRQPCPGPKAWACWNEFIRSYTKMGSWRFKPTLRQQLGPWTTPHKYREWNCVVNPKTLMVYTQQQDQWQASQLTERTRNSWTLTPVPSHTWEMDDTLPFTLPANTRYITCTIPQWSTPNISTDETDWEATFRHYQLRCTEEELENQLQQPHKLYIVTDGGKSGTRATFGWVMATEDTILVEGYGRVWGQPQQSHRSESFGNIGPLWFLIQFAAWRDMVISRPRIEIHCDNLSLLQHKDNYQTKGLPYTTPDLDAIIHTMQLCTEIPAKITHHHVLGHQDTRGKKGINLTIPEQYNIRADFLATWAEENIHLFPECHGPFPNHTASLHNHHGIITSNEQFILHDSLAEKDYIEYLMRNRNWTSEQVDSVDWHSRNSVVNRLPSNQRKFVSKLTHGWLPTNLYKHKLDSNHDSTCPLCSSVETTAHVFQCPGQLDWCMTAMDSTRELLNKLNTAADLKQSILYHLECYINQYPINPEHIDYHSAMGGSTLPWRYIFSGMIPTWWCQLQAKFTAERFDPDVGGTKWGRKVCKHFILLARQAWDLRNKVVFDSPADQPTTSVRLSRIQAKIRVLCQQRNRLLQADQDYFSFDVTNFVSTQKPQHLENWYLRASTFYTQALQRQKQHIKKNYSDIRSFFTRIVRPQGDQRLPQTQQQQQPKQQPKKKQLNQQQLQFPQPNPHHQQLEDDDDGSVISTSTTSSTDSDYSATSTTSSSSSESAGTPHPADPTIQHTLTSTITSQYLLPTSGVHSTPSTQLPVTHFIPRQIRLPTRLPLSPPSPSPPPSPRSD